MLILVATPIGNLGDLSDRAKETLKSADYWLVEDSRVSGKLQSALGLNIPMRVLNDHTSRSKMEDYLDLIESDARVVLLTDAGTPVVSDPGAEIVALCKERGFKIDAVPGPSAVTLGLALSGFFAQRFVFLGFLGKKRSAALETLEPFRTSPMTVVLFESPFRFAQTLSACFEALGERNYAICRELTKMHQQVYWGTLPMVPDEKTVPRKGEVTLVIEGFRRGKDI